MGCSGKRKGGEGKRDIPVNDVDDAVCAKQVALHDLCAVDKDVAVLLDREGDAVALDRRLLGRAARQHAGRVEDPAGHDVVAHDLGERARVHGAQHAADGVEGVVVGREDGDAAAAGVAAAAAAGGAVDPVGQAGVVERADGGGQVG